MEHHILLFAYPVHGAINPCLQCANRLSRMGTRVTILTNVYGHRLASRNFPTSHSQTLINFASFSDGYDDGLTDGDRLRMWSAFRTHASKAIADLITGSANEGCPITCFVYTMLQSWAVKVAREFHVPSALFWTQAASVFVIYYHHFNGYGDKITKMIVDGDNSSQIELPGLPTLGSHDFSSFLSPSNTDSYTSISPILKEQLDTLDAEDKPRILVNTFNELEKEALRAFQRLDMIAIGPLVPLTFLEVKNETSERPRDNIRCWLDSKPESSVIYVSFGSLAELSNEQLEEIGRGLLGSSRPFLWVIRTTEKGEREEDKLSCKEELEQQGMIVPWCYQPEILSHPSLGCFLSHCGWNSSLESLVSGIPMVGFPQMQDQLTNAKLIEDVFKTGIRVKVNKEGILEGDEIKRCIEVVMGGGEKREDLRKNAKKWKDLAREAAKDGGNLEQNLQYFLKGL